MSSWGTLEATFNGEHVDEDHVRQDLPTGTESGPDVGTYSDGQVYVSGRLRDMTDIDSPAVLAWFCGRCALFTDEADLLWEIDSGPRYRYAWSDGALVKLRGLLDA